MTPTLSVSEFVAIFNQSVQMILPEVNVRGELANLRISKNRWVYFDLKDEGASLKFFGPVSILPGPLENGLNLEVNGSPWLHNLYGFSININSLRVVGKGSIAHAKSLLAKKLKSEGLFSQERKRPLPYPPERIALVTSVESAAYSDFLKVINARWSDMSIEVFDCLVQGTSAPAQIIKAVNFISQMATPPDILVLIRGGGSEDDMAVFSDERVVRAVSSSRVPTIVAIGHERDVSLAELAADQRASTPSNAAELLVPDRRHENSVLEQSKTLLNKAIQNIINTDIQENQSIREYLDQKLNTKVEQAWQNLNLRISLLGALNPRLPLAKGYALVRNNHQKQIRSTRDVKINDAAFIELIDGQITTKVEDINEYS